MLQVASLLLLQGNREVNTRGSLTCSFVLTVERWGMCVLESKVCSDKYMSQRMRIIITSNSRKRGCCALKLQRSKFVKIRWQPQKQPNKEMISGASPRAAVARRSGVREVAPHDDADWIPCPPLARFRTDRGQMGISLRSALFFALLLEANPLAFPLMRGVPHHQGVLGIRLRRSEAKIACQWDCSSGSSR